MSHFHEFILQRSSFWLVPGKLCKNWLQFFNLGKLEQFFNPGKLEDLANAIYRNLQSPQFLLHILDVGYILDVNYIFDVRHILDI